MGGAPAILFNIDEITHTVDWTLRYLGSGKVGPLFFTFDQDYWNRLGVDDFFMYKTGATPTRLPNETHSYIWDEQDLPNSIVSADGSKILYGYKDAEHPQAASPGGHRHRSQELHPPDQQRFILAIPCLPTPPWPASPPAASRPAALI